MHFEFAANKMICFQFRRSPMIIPSLGIHKYARQNKARVRVISRVSKLSFELARLSVKFMSVTYDSRVRFSTNELRQLESNHRVM